MVAIGTAPHAGGMRGALTMALEAGSHTNPQYRPRDHASSYSHVASLLKPVRRLESLVLYLEVLNQWTLQQRRRR